MELLLLASHMVGDYIAQTSEMAAHKFSSWKWRTLHVICYTLCFAVALVIAQVPLASALPFLAGLFVLHWITDCRRWASAEPWPAKPIAVDQSLHLVQIALLYWYFLR